MRTPVSLDDDLLKTAFEYTGLTERAELLREALKALIAREAGPRLPMGKFVLSRPRMKA